MMGKERKKNEPIGRGKRKETECGTINLSIRGSDHHLRLIGGIRESKEKEGERKRKNK